MKPTTEQLIEQYLHTLTAATFNVTIESGTVHIVKYPSYHIYLDFDGAFMVIGTITDMGEVNIIKNHSANILDIYHYKRILDDQQ